MYRKNKYRNTKVRTQEGYTFDSRKEYFRYLELVQMQVDGEITDLRCQVKYELIPSQKLDNPVWEGDHYRRTEQAVTYTADFVYVKDGKTVVEDTKSKATRTQQYVIRRKLMKYIHGIEIVEI